jgi:putative spermidine/putrescine transport system permease protein
MRSVYWLVVGLVFVFLLCPLVIVVAVSFGPDTVVHFPPSGFSLRWYVQALRSDLFRNALIDSVALGVGAAAVSTVLGTAAAVALDGARFPGKAVLDALLQSPLVVPGIVLGIALLAAFAGVGLRDAWWRLVLGHVVLTLPYCVRTVAVSLQRLDPALPQAAETLGASPRQIFFEVTMPLIRPGMVAGALFAFVMSFDNVPVSVFLADASTTTLPLAIISYLEYNFDPSVAAISSLVIVVMLLLAVALERLAGLRRVIAS